MRKERMESTMDHTLAARSDFCLERERKHDCDEINSNGSYIRINGTMEQWNNESMEQ